MDLSNWFLTVYHQSMMNTLQSSRRQLYRVVLAPKQQVASKVRQADGQSVPLSPKEYALLCCFTDHPGRALSRDHIMEQAWGYDARVSSRRIDRFATTLRKKIEIDPANPRFIETIREFGYRFRV